MTRRREPPAAPATPNAFVDDFLDRFRDLDDADLLADDARAAGPWHVRPVGAAWGCFLDEEDEPELVFRTRLDARLAVLVLPHLPAGEQYETLQDLARRRDELPPEAAPVPPDHLHFAMGLLLSIATHPRSGAELLAIAGPTACRRAGSFLARGVEAARREQDRRTGR